MRLALIGCGNVAPFYLKTLPKYRQLQLVGVMDQDEERATRFSRYYSVFRYSFLDELLDDTRVELVLNLTNPRSHFEISKACLMAGKHVYSEKPQIRNACRRARHQHDVVSAVDTRPTDRDQALRGGCPRRRHRYRCADRQAGLGADVPRQYGACLAAQHHALSPQDCLFDVVRGLQPHHEVQSAGMDRASRLHPDRAGRRQRARRICARPSRRRGMIFPRAAITKETISSGVQCIMK